MCTICLRAACELGLDALDTGIDGLAGLLPAGANTLSLEAVTPPGSAQWTGLDMGTTWFDRGLSAGEVLTYTVTDSADDYTTGYYSGYDEPGKYLDLSDAGEAIVREAFEFWDAVIDIEMADPGPGAGRPLLQAGGSTAPSTAWAYGPGTWEASGDIWFNISKNFLSPLAGGGGPYRGTYAGATALHEVGHALGLKHPHQGDPTGSYTVAQGSYPQSLMMLDIAMIQQHYGAQHSTLAGDTVYTFDTDTGEMFVDGAGQGPAVRNKVFRTLWDGDGTDLIDLANYTTDLEVDLRPGRGVDLDVGGFAQRVLLDRVDDIYAPRHVYMSLLHEGDKRSLIENAMGGRGDDTFIGNAAANVFDGGAGADIFSGGLGADTFVLGAGADTVADTLAGLDGDTLVDFTASADTLVVVGTAWDRFS